MAPKIAIVYHSTPYHNDSLLTSSLFQYSMYGHIRQLAEAEKKGAEAAGATVDIYQLPETLPQEVLTKMHAPPKPTDIPVLEDPATLTQYDGFLFGIPTRYGNFPAQWKANKNSQLQAFWDQTGTIWQTGGYWGKKAGLFISTATLGGGQESTAIAALSTLTHHGISFVPLGYAKTFADAANLTEVHGGSPWGAGTFAGADGSRQPSELELRVATTQGEAFAQSFSG
ncbi:minor allergen alt a 7 [Trichoderma arundinaceum]|uniref:Minor allergen alt a 7 n=1 Tax=Trichoderma arundinaceum TaxID=490622 RepID=A0A395NP95_TRIAR|nr:minor allergen alt a 7 [Trichoderma arundinaceum]